MEYRTLKQLPAAKKALRKAGYKVTTGRFLINGRPVFYVEDAVTSEVSTLTDRALLEAASHGVVL